MTIERYQRYEPQIHPNAFVHPSAQLLGEVFIEDGASVWPTCVMRGDNGAIRLGAGSNLQDASVCHATLGVSSTSVGVETTVGHRVILHGCKIGSHCLVGMGSIVLDNVEVGDFCFIAAGSLLTPNKKYPPHSFIVGSPAKVIRQVKPEELEGIVHSVKVYQELAKHYRAGG